MDNVLVKMTEGKLQRENTLPSERAKAYHMKLKLPKRQEKRHNLNSGQLGHNFETKGICEIAAGNARESLCNVQQFIRQNTLVQHLIQ